METVYLILCCPRRRYQLPLRITHAAQLNSAIAKAASEYRAEAWEEHRQLHQWVLERLADKQSRFVADGMTEQAALTAARELLIAQAGQQMGLYPVSDQLMLCLGVETGPDAWFLDVQSIRLPFEPMSAEQTDVLWQRLQELQQTFAGLQIQL